MNDYQTYLNSEGWKAKRNMILNMWGNRCALCNEGGELHLHHRDYRRVGNEEVTDVIPLCKKHHEMFHDLVHEIVPDFMSTRTVDLDKETPKPSREEYIASIKDAIKNTERQLTTQNYNPNSKNYLLYLKNVGITINNLKRLYKHVTGEEYAV